MIWRTNRWNNVIYTFWAPLYDWMINLAPFRHLREQTWDAISIPPGQKVLLVGIGTGVDLLYLPERVTVCGIDRNRAMLAKASRKPTQTGIESCLVRADAMRLPLADETFHTAVLNLILSVVPDGAIALREAVRVVQPGGQLLILDKFLPAETPPGWRRRLLNALTNPFGTDINRSFESMLSDLPCRILSDTSAGIRGAYRIILLEKQTETVL